MQYTSNSDLVYTISDSTESHVCSQRIDLPSTRWRLWIRYNINTNMNTVSYKRMNRIWFHTWSTLRLYLTIVFNKNDLIVDEVWNHIEFMRLHDTAFILCRIHMRVDFISDSPSSSCRRKGNTPRKTYQIHLNPRSCKRGLCERPCCYIEYSTETTSNATLPKVMD